MPEQDSRQSSLHGEKDRGPDAEIVTVDEHKLVRKIDWHVLPCICVMYLLAFLDRVNISNAAVFGLQKDLKLTGLQYNTCLVVFFIPYVIFEVPSNYLLKRLRPHVWLSICMFGFGVVTVLQGLTKNYAGLIATRFFLGLFETGMFPGCFYLLAMWYRREESQKRYTFFFSSVTLAGAFGGLIATGIGHLDYVRGYRAWRWVFIIEGAVTAVVAIAWYFLMPDFPEESSFLTPAEKAAVRRRLAEDVGGSAHDIPYTWRDIAGVFRDYKIFLGAFMYFGMIVPAYGYAYFAPSIIKGLGYGNISTQLHSVPPWVCAFGLAMILAYASDKVKHRFVFGVVPALIGMAGFAILLAHPKSINLQYASLFLAVSGTYASMPIFIGWFNMNLAGHLRRGTGTAFQIGFGNIGGIIAAYAFPTEDAPRYTTGYALCVAFIIFALAAAVAYFAAVTVQNVARDKMVASGEAGNSQLSAEEEELRGDLNIRYRYLR